MNPKDFYNQTAGVYDLRHDSPPTRLVRKEEEKLIRKFAQGRTLDFGCGTGVHLNKNIIGIDISEKMLSKAREKSSLLVRASEALPIKSASIGTVFCFLTVLNMVDASRTAQEFFRILKPGGRALLSVASIFDNYGKREKTVQVEGCKLKLNLFTKEEIEMIFQRFSLECFDSLFRRVKPEWGNFREFSLAERLALALEKCFPKERGGMYFMVFKKSI